MAQSNQHGYGVVYTPSSVNAPHPGRSIDLPTHDNTFLLNERSIQWIRIQWLDLINTVRFRVLPRAYFRKMLDSSRPGITLTKATLGLVILNVAPGFSATGEYLYVPDLSTFKICTYAPGHASVMGYFQEKISHPTYGLSVPLCPRSLLKRVVEWAEREAGITCLVGVEHEFILLKETTPTLKTVNDADWSTSAKLPTSAVESEVLDTIGRRLLEAGIELQMFHAEAAPGQYEVVTGPLTPLEAADTVVFTRETIRNVASQFGLKATFAPRLYSNSCGSGAHTHISVHSTRPPTPTQGTQPHNQTMNLVERSFLQGLLDHLPGLCALNLPTAASYARMGDGIWSGGTYVCWGTDNREAPVRLCGSPSATGGGGHHFEVKTVDATSCIYVSLAGMLGVAARAVKNEVELRIGDCLVPVCEMDDQERKRLNVPTTRLPSTIADARNRLREDSVLRDVLGEDFVDAFLNVNQTLDETLSAETEEESVAKLLRFY